jgi:DNA topoisomerase IB
LAIPPAYTDVWICPWTNGHLQAIGTDEAGRRQYRYHEQWRLDRDREKHDRVIRVAARLPQARRLAAEDLARPGLPRRRVLAVAFRLLDLGLFRVGGESYAEEHGSYGLATLRREHVRVTSDGIRFDYVAKSGRRRQVVVADPAVAEVVRTLKRRRDPGPELLAWRERDENGSRHGPATWRDVVSADVNAYIHEIAGDDMSAKDFRTWHATVLAAAALGATPTPASRTGRRRAVVAAMREVSEYLGNTPTVARASYVDPRVVDLWEDGVTIAPVLEAAGSSGDEIDRELLETAVIDLLTLPPRKAAEVIEQRAREAS